MRSTPPEKHTKARIRGCHPYPWSAKSEEVLEGNSGSTPYPRRWGGEQKQLSLSKDLSDRHRATGGGGGWRWRALVYFEPHLLATQNDLKTSLYRIFLVKIMIPACGGLGRARLSALYRALAFPIHEDEASRDRVRRQKAVSAFILVSGLICCCCCCFWWGEWGVGNPSR